MRTPTEFQISPRSPIWTGYAAVLLAGAIYLVTNYHAVTKGILDYTASVALLSAAWASFRAPQDGPRGVGRVVLVNLLAHAGYWLALWGEQTPGPPSCGLGITMFAMSYPLFALFAAGVAAALAVALTACVRAVRRQRARSAVPIAPKCALVRSRRPR
jgi:hypothetical protein